MDANRIAYRLAAAVLLAAALIAGCGDETRRTLVAPPPPAAPPPAPPPAPAPATPPSISSVTPAASSTAGGASMEIVGTGFQSGVVAILDGVRIQPRFVWRTVDTTTMHFETLPHPAGTIDIIVTNPDDQSARYAAGHTYVVPTAFDPNGDWLGVVDNVDGSALGFTIRSGKLVRAYCQLPSPFTELPLAEPISVTGGVFFVSELMAGRIVSAREMVGTMNFRGCSHMSFRAFLGPTTSLHR